MCRSNGCKHKHDEKLSQIAFHRNSISQLHRTLIYTLLNIMSVYFFFTLPFLPVCRTVLFFGRSFLLPHWFEVVCILSQTSSHVQCKIASFFPITLTTKRKRPAFFPYMHTATSSDRRKKNKSKLCAYLNIRTFFSHTNLVWLFFSIHLSWLIYVLSSKRQIRDTSRNANKQL